jgi:hypothetical protein
VALLKIIETSLMLYSGYCAQEPLGEICPHLMENGEPFIRDSADGETQVYGKRYWRF